jgi:IS1 family transposase
MVSMNRLSSEKRAQVIASLVEGNSSRTTVRMTGVAKNTVTKLLVDIGTVCSIHMDRALRDLASENIQCDEIWAFCYAKERNVPVDKRGEFGYGDVWTWVALDADSKLVITYRVGTREIQDAYSFAHDLKRRLRNRVQLSTDGLNAYLGAVSDAFRGDIDYAQQIKVFGNDPEVTDKRYSPAVCTEVKTRVITGEPSPDLISTSYVERQNLTMRMSMRRFTRLTNGFSKKVENLAAAVSLHFMHYNFCRVHQTLKTTPAVAAGVADHVWTMAELIGLLEGAEATPIKRGPYKRRAADSA